MIILEVCFLAASMPAWLEWGFWFSPLTYGEIGLTVNEFLAPRWGKVIFIQSTLVYMGSFPLITSRSLRRKLLEDVGKIEFT
jgi:hypothetical protein